MTTDWNCDLSGRTCPSEFPYAETRDSCRFHKRCRERHCHDQV